MSYIIQTDTIGYRRWCAPDPKCVLILVHGLGAHGGRWEAFGDFLANRGISAYAIELRASGSAAPAGQHENLRLYRDRVLRLFGIASRENPGKKVFLVGESMGAIVSFLLCVDRPGLAGGLVCISPAFAAGRSVTPKDYLRVLASLLYRPEKECALPFDSSMCTRDIEERERLDHDPHEYRAASSRVLFEVALAQIRARSVGKRMLTPVVFLLAGEDRIADTGAAQAVFRGLAVRDKTLIEFPGMYHSLSIELGKEKVFEEIVKWVEERA